MTSTNSLGANALVADSIASGSVRGSEPLPWAASFSFDASDPDERRIVDVVAESVRHGILVGADWNVTILTPEGPVPDVRSLDTARSQVADAVAGLYDFGVDVVQDFDGWNTTVPGDEWTRSVYLEPDIQDAGDDSEKALLTVRFHPESAVPREVYAIDGRGNVFGSFEHQEVARP